MPLPPCAPASPEGVAAAPSLPGTTVTAVTVLWLPSGRVVVCKTTEVLEVRRVLRLDDVMDVGDLLWVDLESVTYPPPTVETMVTPSALVVVMTSPAVSVGIAPAADVMAAEKDSSAPGIVVGVLPPPMTPLGDVLVEVTVSGGPLGEPPTAVVDVPGLPGVSMTLPSTGPIGTGVTTAAVVGDSPAFVGLSATGVVVGGFEGTVPLLGIS